MCAVLARGVVSGGRAVPVGTRFTPGVRGRDFAWSLTTGYSDAVDTKAELLCAPEGEEVTEDSNHYMFKGECKEMESREETFIERMPDGKLVNMTPAIFALGGATLDNEFNHVCQKFCRGLGIVAIENQARI